MSAWAVTGRRCDMTSAQAATIPPRESARTIRHEMRSDSICVLTLDRPGSSANFLDRRALEELAEELDFVEETAGLRGVVFVSAKRSIFVAGADLNSMRPEAPPALWRELIEFGQR